VSKPRIAIIISHPIQHFCPQYVSLAKKEDIVIKVFFASALGYKKYIDPNFKQEISWANLNLDRFDHVFLNGDDVIASDKYLDAPNLNNELDQYKPHLVIVHGYFQKYQRRAYQWAKKNNVKIAYGSDSELRHKRNILKEALKYFFIKHYFSSINYFLSVGNANEEYYQHYGVSTKKIIRMHFSIDIDFYKECFLKKKQLRKGIRQQYGIQDSEIALAVVGKLVDWKSQDHIIEAMQLLEQKGLILQLFIIGSGTMQEAWEQKSAALKKSKVHFTGFVKPEQLPGFYAATDIYVHPAAIEPHSLAISEAIYMGCPIIISDRCGSYGATDDVQIGKNGYVFRFGNINDLATQIELLVKNSEARSRFGEYSHTIAVEFQKRSHGYFMNQLSTYLVEI
jgi:glycosyltransferase involved in cell wall biosynthesis